ncbi:hypothetical protein AN958_12796, partial [Leucoagaricus sp. SymC.cos]
LLNSGASGNFIDPQLVQKYNLPRFPLNKPSKIYNTDGSQNQAGQCTHYSKLKITINKKVMTIHNDMNQRLLEVMLFCPTPALSFSPPPPVINPIPKVQDMAKTPQPAIKKPAVETKKPTADKPKHSFTSIVKSRPQPRPLVCDDITLVKLAQAFPTLSTDYVTTIH